jgi:hypothetical protein
MINFKEELGKVIDIVWVKGAMYGIKSSPKLASDVVVAESTSAITELVKGIVPGEKEHKPYCQAIDENGKDVYRFSGGKLIQICDCGTKEVNNFRSEILKRLD